MDRYSWPGPRKQVASPIAEPCYPLLCAPASLIAASGLVDLTAPAAIGLIAALFFRYFLRDPDRAVPGRVLADVSAEAGTVCGGYLPGMGRRRAVIRPAVRCDLSGSELRC